MIHYLFRAEAIRAAVQYSRDQQGYEVLVPKFRRDLTTNEMGYVVAVYDRTGQVFRRYL